MSPIERSPLVIALASLLATPAFAADVLNGGLESGSVAFIETVSAGNSANSWRAVGANVEFVRNGFAGAGDVVQFAHEGDWFVDLNGIQGPGGIGQDIATAVGQQYRIEFWMSANAGPLGSTSADGAKTLDVLWNNAVVGSFTFVHQAGDGWSNLRWEQHSVIVSGASGLDSLELRSTSSFYSAAGPFVDAVSITAVPEPGTWATLAAGLALVAVGARRRR